MPRESVRSYLLYTTSAPVGHVVLPQRTYLIPDPPAPSFPLSPLGPLGPFNPGMPAGPLGPGGPGTGLLVPGFPGSPAIL